MVSKSVVVVGMPLAAILIVFIGSVNMFVGAYLAAVGASGASANVLSAIFSYSIAVILSRRFEQDV